ncbi:MAG: hypothetical protein ABIV11_05495 [Gemmatimonadaceae bacterium]
MPASNPDSIYLDHAATIPVREEVLEEMRPFLGARFGNPSSTHRWGHVSVLDVSGDGCVQAASARGSLRDDVAVFPKLWEARGEMFVSD